MFLRNYWYVAALDDEIGERPLGRTILGEPVVLFRNEPRRAASPSRIAARTAACRCRWASSSATCCNATITACVSTAPANACACPARIRSRKMPRVRTYPVVERYRWIWIWMGDPALADPAQILRLPLARRSDWGAKPSYLHVEANWQLVVDNLLDLTHLAFVHETTIGNMALVEHAAVKVTRAPNNVVVTRWIIDQPAPPTFVKVGKFTGNVDRWQIIDLHAAGVPAARRRRLPDRHRRAGGPPRRRHRHAQPQCHHAGDRNHRALFLGAGARFRAAQRRR